MCIDKLDGIINKYHNTYHSTNKVKPVNVKSNTYIDSSKEIDNKNPKFKIRDIVRISKYKTIFAKDCTSHCSEKAFLIKKVQNTVSRHMLLMILMEKKIAVTFYENELKKINQKEFRFEKSNQEKRC